MLLDDLTDFQVKACRTVCGHYDDPVGEPIFTAEIMRAAGMEPGLEDIAARELAALVDEGYLTREVYAGGAIRYCPTDKARSLYPEKYPSPIGTARPFKDETKEWEDWKAAGERGPCPMCGAAEDEMHGGKWCLGMGPYTGPEGQPRVMKLDERGSRIMAEMMEPWSPYLIDMGHLKWIIEEFSRRGLWEHHDLERGPIEIWLSEHGQDKHFAVCTECGAEAIHPFRERFELPATKGTSEAMAGIGY